METIKNYLESMFRNLPKTEKVNRAKSELLQMMEDKYSELIESGVSENEAIGTVISEFGNLDELADDLGISEENTITKNVNENSRKVSLEEIKNFLSWRMKVSIYRCIGIACCICCVVPPIIIDGLGINENLGAILLFVMIAIGVLFIVFAGKDSQNWKFLKKEHCSIDEKTYQYVADKKHNFVRTHSIMTAVGIACFILCVVPAIAFDSFNSKFFENLGGACLFIFVATGVFLLVYSSYVKSAYNFILNINNPDNYMSDFENGSNGVGKTVKNNGENTNIQNSALRTIISVYWPTVTCIYLCWSFFSFDWHITWIIWPIAGVIYSILKAVSK